MSAENWRMGPLTPTASALLEVMESTYDDLEEVQCTESDRMRIRELMSRVGNRLLSELAAPAPDLPDWKHHV